MPTFFNLQIVLFLLIFLGITHKMCVLSSNNSTSFVCNDADKESLLKLKESVTDPGDKLSSWRNSTDCCTWEGIGCDTETGRVAKLHLRSDDTNDLYLFNITSSLVELKFLEYLDLSGNSFAKNFSNPDSEYGNIPEFLGLIRTLTYLNLSRMNLGEFIPNALANLTNLEVLDLSSMTQNKFNESRRRMAMSDLGWLSRMLSLKHLDVSYINLNIVRNLWQELSVLPSLSVLDLSECSLNDTHFSPRHNINSTFLSSIQQLYISYNTIKGPFPLLLKNMTSLRVLDVSGSFHVNSFVNASIPEWLGNLKNLQHLDLSRNNFGTVEGGLLRMLRSLCHLKSIYLDYNNIQYESFETNNDGPLMCLNGYDLEILHMANSGLKGYLPDWVGQFNKLTELDLSHNLLHGHIPAWIGNLLALEVLHLSNNQLNGTIPSTIWNLLSLTDLDVSNNQLNGTIPATIWNLLALTVLDVSNNQLNGEVPESIGQLSALKKLDLSSNLFQGEISAMHFLNLTMLKELRLGSNQISINIKPNWVPPFPLTYLDMTSCKIIGFVFPQWLESQNKLEYLLVSNASISGPLPKWFQGSNLLKLDLSHNQISGPIPQNIGVALVTVDLSHNMFNGTIPSSFCKMENLLTLDLSDNMLFGDIPNCWKREYQVVSIRLSSNKLTGVIPSSFGNLQYLAFLHLNKNGLRGELPRSLIFLTTLITLNVGENKLSGNIPEWIGTMQSLQILRLRKNMFGGHVPEKLCNLPYLRILDLASNNLNGSIPPCLGNLTEMIMDPSFAVASSIGNQGVDVSTSEEEKIEVVIKAKDVEYTKIVKLVVNLDLSSNKLVGTIPNELSHLIKLIGLNLSFNHLNGNIPKTIGDMKSLESLDLSNNNLYGTIPATMSDLTSLAYLNLSQNNLSGKIPSGHQLQTLLNPSIYMGNPKLCGDPLPIKCSGDEPFHEENTEEDDDDNDKSDKLWFYMAITLGYAIGLWVVIGTLMLKKTWRYAYFRLADDTIDLIYVTVAIKYARLKKKLMCGKGSS